VPGSPPVLACVGLKVSVIDNIIEDIPPSYFEEFVHATDLWEATDLANIGYQLRKVYQEIHSRLHEWLRRYSVHYLPPVPTVVQFLEALDGSTYGGLNLENKGNGLYQFTKRFRDIRERMEGKATLARPQETPMRIYRDNSNMRPFQYQPEEMKRKHSLFRWLVVAMTYPKGLKDLHGRRVAALRSSIFALVPQAAQVGDLICELETSTAPYVVRELPKDSFVKADKFLLSDMDAKIVRQFQDEMEEFGTDPRLAQKVSQIDPRIGHFGFVGECMMERRMNSEQEMEWGKRKIFALH